MLVTMLPHLLLLLPAPAAHTDDIIAINSNELRNDKMVFFLHVHKNVGDTIGQLQ